jgi:alkaline phosphatase
MRKTFILFLLLPLLIMPAKSIEKNNVKQVKNVILMIPDGTSIGAVSVARWLQWFNNPDKPKLNIDPYICGTVRTHSSNAPIGDSAPTTSCYMTGYPSRTGYVSTYPESDPENDIYPTDPSRAYQPLTTVLEAARMIHGKSTGLVFTCEFPHATPADCSAHSYNRNRYDWITSQMVHNSIDVVIGGGAGMLNPDFTAYLKAHGCSVYNNDINGMRADKNNKMWALYNNNDMAYDINRNPDKEPSIEEMTRLAISRLSANPNGFFLMVEGSKVDWAAHANDPIGIATEFLAFDRACGAALDFAHENGETAVVILPDHGNSGISLGVEHCKGYDKLSKSQLFGQLSKYKANAEGIANLLNTNPASEAQAIFRNYTGLELTDSELKSLNNHKGYRNSPIPEAQRSLDDQNSLYSTTSLSGWVSKWMTSKTCIGFTTSGHTGEDVFLAVYHPQNTLPIGMNTNIELNAYLCALYGIDRDKLDELTAKNYAPHTQVFKDYKYEIIPATDEKSNPTLIVKGKKTQQLTITPNTNIIQKKITKTTNDNIELSSVIVYVDKNNTFYLPADLVAHLK